MKISLIAAVAANGVIGGKYFKKSTNKKKLFSETGMSTPMMSWHIPEDLRHFKKLTLKKAIIMGRRTFNSIGKALPKRLNIVISRTSLGRTTIKMKNEKKPFPGCLVTGSLEEALKLAKEKKRNKEIFIIGGGQIYEQALPLATHLYLTEIHKTYHGEELVYFPQWDKKQWHELSRKKSKDGELSYDFVVYERD